MAVVTYVCMHVCKELRSYIHKSIRTYTSVPIVVESVPNLAFTVIRAKSVVTKMTTSSITNMALIYICK